MLLRNLRRLGGNLGCRVGEAGVVGGTTRLATILMDSQLPFGTISLEVGSQQTPLEKVNEDFVEIECKTTSVLEVGSSFMQGKMFQGDGPHNRPQQVIGPHKVAPVKEWKPKLTNPTIPAQALVTEVPAIPISVPVEAPPSSTT
ncbi:hypothetical protein HanIR_Chr13g0658361 [Helianthus annuus]|nr:hypothetical protein HanIR_Chr13g0658361 [Helianthus annuus]